MIIKAADDKRSDLDLLIALVDRPDVAVEKKSQIQQEIRKIRAGAKGESEAAYELEFHYGKSKYWMIINDLRIECDGRVAQIDHLLINRFMEIWVCESKHFAEGIAINEHGEFSALYSGKSYGVPSPIEQNRKHITVLESVFKSGLINLPTRLGITIRPSYQSLILVSKRARVIRPTTKIAGLECIIKNDQIKSRIDKVLNSDNNILNAAKLVSGETVEDFARRLAAIHAPITIDWHARFGLSRNIEISSRYPVLDSSSVSASYLASKETNRSSELKTSKLKCASCGTKVTYNVAKFCWFNKARFHGSVFCMDCQKTVS